MRFSVRAKLFGGFGVVVVMLVAVVAVALYAMSSLGSASGRISGNSVPKVLAADAARLAAADMPATRSSPARTRTSSATSACTSPLSRS